MIARELSLVLQQRVHDPRLAEATVTGARVSKDLRRATVFVAGTSTEQSDEVLKALRHSQAFLRRELSRRLYLRYMPELDFQIDDTYDRAQRIEELLDEVVDDDDSTDDSDS